MEEHTTPPFLDKLVVYITTNPMPLIGSMTTNIVQVAKYYKFDHLQYINDQIWLLTGWLTIIWSTKSTIVWKPLLTLEVELQPAMLTCANRALIVLQWYPSLAPVFSPWLLQGSGSLAVFIGQCGRLFTPPHSVRNTKWAVHALLSVRSTEDCKQEGKFILLQNRHWMSLM